MDHGRQAGDRDDAAFLPPLHANEVQLWLSVIAYTLVAAAGGAQGGRQVVADQSAARVEPASEPMSFVTEDAWPDHKPSASERAYCRVRRAGWNSAACSTAMRT